ncbi:hypothetical protein QUA43_13940 [Microcoleus sp. N9_B4]|uniref:hypothetical protein n=1 Tax=Microcoleus sp. N9_B4 TaxID=3055386 RepID=UPI002FD47147
MKPVNSRTNRCTGRHEYHWLVARHSVMYAAIFACILCATLYGCGFYPNSIARSKFGLHAKTFYWRAIGAIDKPPASETKADTTSITAEDFGSTP